MGTVPSTSTISSPQHHKSPHHHLNTSSVSSASSRMPPKHTHRSRLSVSGQRELFTSGKRQVRVADISPSRSRQFTPDGSRLGQDVVSALAQRRGRWVSAETTYDAVWIPTGISMRTSQGIYLSMSRFLLVFSGGEVYGFGIVW